MAKTDKEMLTTLGGDIQMLARVIGDATGPHGELVCAIKALTLAKNAQTEQLRALTQMIRAKF